MANSVSQLIERGIGGVCPLHPHQDTRAQARRVMHFKRNNIKHNNSIKHVFAKKNVNYTLTFVCCRFMKNQRLKMWTHMLVRHLCGSDGFRRKNRETNLDAASYNSGIVLKSN